MEVELAFRGNCRGCDREMISQRDWLALDRDQRVERAYIMGYGLCSTCHGRARSMGTLPFPAPPPVNKPKKTTQSAAGSERWHHARSDARRDMKQVGFAQTPKVCKHDNGIVEQRVVRDDRRYGHGNGAVKKECRECGLHLSYDKPDNPAPCTALELAAYQAPPPPVEPWTWGVMQYRRGRAARPKECPQGHPLDRATIIFGAWSHQHRRRTYTCRVCREIDPYIAAWRPLPAEPRQVQPKHTNRLGVHAVIWSDGSLHVIADTWSNMALHHRQRHGA